MFSMGKMKEGSICTECKKDISNKGGIAFNNGKDYDYDCWDKKLKETKGDWSLARKI